MTFAVLIVTGIQDVNSKWSPGSAIDLKEVSANLYEKESSYIHRHQDLPIIGQTVNSISFPQSIVHGLVIVDSRTCMHSGVCSKIQIAQYGAFTRVKNATHPCPKTFAGDETRVVNKLSRVWRAMSLASFLISSHREQEECSAINNLSCAHVQQNKENSVLGKFLQCIDECVRLSRAC